MPFADGGKEYHKTRYQSDPDHRRRVLQSNKQYRINNRDKINESARKRYAENRAHWIEYLGGKCVGCGTTENLQFDHIDRTNKTHSIAGILGRNRDKVKPEIDKCRLLCEDCHKVKTMVNHDHDSILKGYTLSSIQTTDDQIVITYAKTSLL